MTIKNTAITLGAKTFGLGVTLAILAGCATDPIKPTNDSYALQVLKASGMYRKLKDTPLPKDTVNSINTTLFNTSSILSGYSNPLPGMSGSAMVGIGLVSLLAADEPEARNSVIAFMPADLTAGGKNPNEVLYNFFKDAFAQAAQESGFAIKQQNVNFSPKNGSLLSKDYGFFYLANTGNQTACTNKNNSCLASMPFGPVVQVKAEWQKKLLGHLGITAESLLFDPSDTLKYTHFDLMDDMSADFNELAFLQKVSQHLPSWVYFYVAPNRIKVGAGEKLKVPLIINAGKLNFFVTPI
jgi:hypothetical protein